MKKLVKSDNGYTVSEISGGTAIFDCIKAPIKPVLGEAMTPGDGIISALTFFVTGAMVGGTVGYKWVKKTQTAYKSLISDDEPVAV